MQRQTHLPLSRRVLEAQGVFDERHKGALASARWLSEAQWACKPDPQPDVATAPGPGVAPLVRRVGRGSAPTVHCSQPGPPPAQVPA